MAKDIGHEAIMHERRLMAYEMRLKGKTYRQIGAALGVSQVTAMTDVKTHLEATELPLVDEIRKTEVDRLLRYLERLDERVDEGDDKAISIAIKISERLCKMLGADMPTRTEVQVTEVTQQDIAIQELIREVGLQNDRALAEAAIKRTVNKIDGVSDE